MNVESRYKSLHSFMEPPSHLCLTYDLNPELRRKGGASVSAIKERGEMDPYLIASNKHKPCKVYKDREVIAYHSIAEACRSSGINRSGSIEEKLGRIGWHVTNENIALWICDETPVEIQGLIETGFYERPERPGEKHFARKDDTGEVYVYASGYQVTKATGVNVTGSAGLHLRNGETYSRNGWTISLKKELFK